MSVATEEVPDSTVALLATAMLHRHATTGSVHGEGLGLGLLGCILLAFIHLLHKGLCLFLVDKGQSGEAWRMLQLERVEEGSVLIIGKRVIYLLIPDHASVRWRDIDQLDPECVTHEVVDQHGSTLKPRIGPSVPVRVGNVETGNSDRLYLIC